MADVTESLLDVQDLRVQFGRADRPVRAVDGVSFSIAAGETLALVGESGSGKSVTALSLSRLLPAWQARVSGAIRFGGSDILGMGEADLRRLRGKDIAYVFQEPASALNPVFTIGWQIEEALRLHERAARSERRARAIEWLGHVGLPEPAKQYRKYPHQLSGGMQQRAVIAMALACEPRLLVADEPTTALDVTVQDQILKLLASLQRELRMSLLLITHNLAIVAGVADRVCVMYAGRVVEEGSVDAVLRAPRHPYTRALLAAVPRLDATSALRGIEGTVPDPANFPKGCAFHPRCPAAKDLCFNDEPAWEEEGAAGGRRGVRCHFWREGRGA